MSPAADQSASVLSATYINHASSGSDAFSKPPPQISPQPTTDERTGYLAALRTSVTSLQSDINTYLTEKMEEDKRAAGGDTANGTADDAKEEENYGEEVADEEG